jgi:acetyl-CoA acetyltransferase
MGAVHPMRRRRAGAESWFGGGGAAVDDALAMAGVTRGRLDVAELYDPFSIVTLCLLEEYGFCESGQAGKFVRGGGIAPVEIAFRTVGAVTLPAVRFPYRIADGKLLTGE